MSLHSVAPCGEFADGFIIVGNAGPQLQVPTFNTGVNAGTWLAWCIRIYGHVITLRYAIPNLVIRGTNSFDPPGNFVQFDKG